jgi:hypothetical protein
VIAPLGDEGSETRHRADNVLDFVIRPAAEARYEIVRADTLATPGLITTEIVSRLRAADLVIADLTGYNPNVLYELAIRHCTRKPVIHISDPESPPPFDIAQQRTIFFDARDLRSASAACARIAAQIETIEQDPTRFDNPLSAALDVLGARRKRQARPLLPGGERPA